MESSLTLNRGYGDTRILSKLIRDHLSGKTSTKSSLIGSSGMSYGTALRAINSMEKNGLIVKRPRTTTEIIFPASFSKFWMNGRVRKTYANYTAEYLRINDDDNKIDYYFGSSYSSGKVLPPRLFEPKSGTYWRLTLVGACGSNFHGHAGA